MNKLPKELKGLWKLQYEPLEKEVLKELKNREGGEEIIKKYKSFSYQRKIFIFDKLAHQLGL